MDEKKIEILDKIREKITNKNGFEVLKQPRTFEVWCGGKYVLITLYSIVDVHRNGYGELFAIDSKCEIRNLDDFLTKQLEVILDDLSTKEVKVKMEVEVTFNLDDDCETDNIEHLANDMVSNTLEYRLNTCYGNETFVDYNISNVEVRK